MNQIDPSALAGAQSVDRALMLLSLIGRRSESGIGLTQLTTESGLNKATVRRLTLALIRAGQVEQDDDTRLYHLGPEAYLLGVLAGLRHGLMQVAAPNVARLARETGDAAFISVRRGQWAVCLHREDGAHPIRTYALLPGLQHPLGVGAGSLAMLAALPPDEAQAVMDANLQALTAYSRLTIADLQEQLEQARQTGIALNPGLIYEESWGMGIALHHPDGSLAGALSLAAVESRMKQPRRQMLADSLRREAADIETRLAQLRSAPDPRTMS